MGPGTFFQCRSGQGRPRGRPWHMEPCPEWRPV